MKLADDAYTIMIFRGVTANPRRVRIPRRFAKWALSVIAVLFVVQTWGTAHYVVQTRQGDELTTLRQEISQSRSRMQVVSGTVADIKRSLLAMQERSQKLQTMFGLELESPENTGSNGQGGAEVPLHGDPGQRAAEAESHAVAGPGATSSPRPLLVTAIQKDLAWLTRQTSRQQYIFDQLEEAATQRFERWNATPSIWPVKGSVTSKFGPRISPFTGKKTFHAGVDIGVRTGRKIVAPAQGKVMAAVYDPRMGNIIRLGHGYGIKTVYGHLSRMLVKRGQTVKRGDVIGLVGSTGRFSTGPHLHYQVVVNDKIVNPLQYILD